MNPTDDKSVSRRQWVGSALPMIGAAAAWPTVASAEPMDSKQSAAPIYNIRDFGAKGDGVTLDTAALQNAIDSAASHSGGTVLVPAGVFVIGTVELKSNITLHIEAGGKLLGTGDGTHYHAVDAIPLRGDSTLEDGHVALLFAANALNVTVEGPGVIDGNGNLFRSATRGQPPPSGIGGARRPYSLLFYRCRNLRLQNLELADSAFHAVRIIQSTYVRADGVHIHSRVNHNNDGFHFISAQHVNLVNCIVESQDDACALFGSCQFIAVTNCSFSTRWSVFRFGGGFAQNVVVSNCIIYQAYGCPIKMHCYPGSRFENMSFSNLLMQDVTGPISIGVGPRTARDHGPATEPSTSPAAQRAAGIVRNISFSDIRAFVTAQPDQLPDSPVIGNYNVGEIRSCIVLNGINDCWLEEISFDNVHITFGGGGTAEDAAIRDVPQRNGEYFELGRLPAYGMFARNVRGLDDEQRATSNRPARPAARAGLPAGPGRFAHRPEPGRKSSGPVHVARE